MTCEEIREKISCMLDNELNAEDSAIVMEHLASCPECMSIFEAFHAVSVSLEELEEVPDGFTESVMHQIRVTASPKHRRRGLFWLAGMAACLAVVLLAGTGFSSTHQYVDGSDREVAQYVNIMTPPKKLPAVVQPTATILPDVDIVDVTPVPTDAVDEGVIDELSTDPAISPAPTAEPTPTPVPTPKPTPKPVVIPIWPMTALTDLLLVVDYADYDLHTGTPDLELDVPDRNGNPVNVCVWMELEHNRLYCKSKDTMTAWYTIGTPKQLLRLMRENKPTPTPTATPTPTPTPEVVTPTPELVTPTPDVVTPTPEVVSPTPDVVTPTPEVVTPTPDVTVTPVPTTVPDDGIGSGTEAPIESGEAAEEANIAPETE